MIGNIDILVKELCKLPKEFGWVEFKHNNCEPNMIGEDISALANTATLNDRDYAYMIWGVDDTTHEIIGTKVRLQMEKKGEQELENWLRYMLSKNADFEYATAAFRLAKHLGMSLGILPLTNVGYNYASIESLNADNSTYYQNTYSAGSLCLLPVLYSSTFTSVRIN